jgi:hypothetical protein
VSVRHPAVTCNWDKVGTQRLPACRLQQCSTDAQALKHNYYSYFASSFLHPSPPFFKDAHGDPYRR